jgi:hypothetical protein
VATEAAWLNGNNLEKETKKKKEKMKERLDTHRPSHGRVFLGLPKFGWLKSESRSPAIRTSEDWIISV